MPTTNGHGAHRGEGRPAVDAGDRAAAAGARTDPQLVAEWTGETTEPIESATVVLVRGGADRLEVFMLERHIETDFAGGALVWPGGRVDDRDRLLDPARWTGLDLTAVAGDDPADLVLGWHVAAVREAFEEAGFLLAHREGGGALTEADLDAPSVVEARARLGSRDDDWYWDDWLADEGLVLDLGALRMFSWWITPHGLHKRYTTRFFVAPVPEDQVGVHDDVETVSSRWLTPQEALDAGASGAATVVYPTRQNLRVLTRFATAEDLLAAADAGGLDLRPHLPEVVQTDDGEIRVRHPHTGDLDLP